MVKSADCLVLGAGMVGVCTALHLQKRGQDVVLIDRQPAGEGTSFGNAGIIQAEGIVPYMLPLDALRLFQMLLNRRGEAHVHYRALVAFAPWLARYGLNSFDKAIT
ncbi:MAG: FAD-dependent oxidoreductase, partial [Pseudomonadota bacterium]